MSTQFVSASYQEIIDLHTESDQVSVIGIHCPVGDTPHRMFEGFYKQFKKYRYLGCSVSFVPAARLPVDPLQVSYEAGEPTIDPRDMLNPLMFHGCHGEDLGAILNKFYAMGVVGPSSNASIYSMLESDSAFMVSEKDTTILQDANMLESLYYKALTDNTWKKAHPQRGFRKAGLRPLVYSMATTHQLMPGTLNTGLGPENDDLFGIGSTGDSPHIAGIPTDEYAISTQTGNKLTVANTKRATQFLTPRLTGLGWMDTYNVLSNYAAGYSFTPQTLDTVQQRLLSEAVNPATLPCIFMGVILLPPAYKTEQWFRMIITHHFQFKQFRGISYDPSMSNPAYNDWNTATPLLGGEPPEVPDGPTLGDSPDDSILPPVGEKYTILGFTYGRSRVLISDGEKWVEMTPVAPVLPAGNTTFSSIDGYVFSTYLDTLTIFAEGIASSNNAEFTSQWSSAANKWISVTGATDFDYFGPVFDEEDEETGDLAQYLNGVIENGTAVTIYDGESDSE